MFVPYLHSGHLSCRFITGSMGLNIDPQGLRESMMMLTPEVDITHNALLLCIWCKVGQLGDRDVRKTPFSKVSFSP